MNSEQFFSSLWEQYIAITPQAEQIHALFLKQNHQIVNDHVAFRTFDHSDLNIAVFEPYIFQLGYTFLNDYHFPNKYLYAKSYLAQDPQLPKIFISQLICQKLSQSNQKIINTLLESISSKPINCIDALYKGRLWDKPSWQQYQSLLAESEYAAWLSVMGLRANHFTISINHLDSHVSIEAVNQFLKNNGFILNMAGGEIKGSPEELLEQSSTMADKMEFEFADGDRHRINTCYYEFARRYPDNQGDLFQGFVAASADKIFESTHMER